MAWIEIHQSLPGHKKTMQCAEELGISEAQMVGHLVCFWLWALDNCSDGSLPDVTPRMIARAALWDGDCNALCNALCNAGFLEHTRDGHFHIHDWQDYAGRLIAKRTANRERQRRHRAGKNAAKPRDGEKARHADGNAGVTRDATVTSRGTVQYSTYNEEEEEMRAREPEPEPTDEEINRLGFTVYGTCLTAADEIQAYIDETSRVVVAEALREAIAKARSNPIPYFRSIMANWKARHPKTLADVKRIQAEFRASCARDKPPDPSPSVEDQGSSALTSDPKYLEALGARYKALRQQRKEAG